MHHFQGLIMCNIKTRLHCFCLKLIDFYTNLHKRYFVRKRKTIKMPQNVHLIKPDQNLKKNVSDLIQKTTTQLI